MKRLKFLPYAFSLMMGFSALQAAQAVQAAGGPGSAIDDCSKELLVAYFPENFVKETLKKFNVPQDKWNAIVQDLSGKEREIVKLVEEKAAKMNPNPLKDTQQRKDPQQHQAAVNLFKETLMSVFSQTLKKNGVTDDKKIEEMLNDIQKQKAIRFAQCMEKHKSEVRKLNSEQSREGQSNPNRPAQYPNSPNTQSWSNSQGQSRLQADADLPQRTSQDRDAWRNQEQDDSDDETLIKPHFSDEDDD